MSGSTSAAPHMIRKDQFEISGADAMSLDDQFFNVGTDGWSILGLDAIVHLTAPPAVDNATEHFPHTRRISARVTSPSPLT